MRGQLHITSSQLNQMERDIKTGVQEGVVAAERAMAETFQECVLANFGASGPYRPWSGWHPLSPAYAKKVGRTYATLEVTGRLKSSVFISLNERGNFTVSADNSDVPYATAHQYGNPKGNRGHPGLPAREYFPMDENNEVTRQVYDLCVNAAQEALERSLA